MIVLKEIDNKKYFWDGVEYESEEEARQIKSRYEGEGFEAHLEVESGKYRVFTRRVVKEVIVEGS